MYGFGNCNHATTIERIQHGFKTSYRFIQRAIIRTHIRGTYYDLVLELYLVMGSTETLSQTSSAYTTKTYSFSYTDAGQQPKVVLKRVSNGAVLGSTKIRGALPPVIPTSTQRCFFHFNKT
jgi:hypothetical protein